VIFAHLADTRLYSFESYKVKTGNGKVPEARVRLQKNEVILEATAEGDGPIDAIFKAIDKIVGAYHKLEDFQVKAVTETKEAMGASARAYVEAVNRIYYLQSRQSGC